MTCIMHDVQATIHEQLEDRCSKELSSLLYADDTLLMGISASAGGVYLQAVADHGAQYGLELQVQKTQLLNVRCDGSLHAPDGSQVKQMPSIIYLGSLLHSDGRCHHELSRRLGLASSTFRALSRVWGHSSLSKKRKIHCLTLVF